MDRSRQFVDWIASIGLSQHTQTLLENEIDFDVLRDINEDELAQIGLPLGARKRLMKAALIAGEDESENIAGNTSGNANQQTPEDPNARNLSRPQRRLITVLFFDLAGSTALSNVLDPEDLQDIINNFQSAVATVISSHDGFIARYMGDGVLCYFGWPTAREDSAVRAVRAALQAQAEVAKLPHVLSVPLQARAGIATGNVVVGDLIGEGASAEEAIVGATPNLAARLQGMAEPGDVVVSETTRSLIGNQFQTETLDPLTLKGFDKPELAAIVTGERDGSLRFAHAAQSALPIPGREHELELLRSRWQQACTGEGQCVLLSGEAGIGKSRLVSALLEAENLQQQALVFQCSPYHSDTALWPVVAYLREKLNAKPEGNTKAVRERLQQFLSANHMDAEQLIPLADLLGIKLSGSAGQDSAPQERRTQVLLTVLNWIEVRGSAAHLVVIEDAHWIDPTTQELLQQLLDRLERQPLLLLVTSRTESRLQLNGNLLQTLSLNRLGQKAARQMIDTLLDSDLSDTALQDLISRSDGVPLYLEELARASSHVATEAVPLTLQNGLMARLDALPHVRRLAQEAACIGRDFEFSLLQSVSEASQAALKQGLEELVSSGLVLNSSDSGGRLYRFRHALLRDSAYESLLKRERSQIHFRIANALVDGQTPAQSTSPDQIAIHFQLANSPADAFAYWVEACRRAAESAATNEALAHASRALAALEHAEPGRQRDELEYQLQMSYGSAQQAAKGFAESETGVAFSRAAVLAEQLGSSREQLLAQLNLWTYKHHSGDFKTASNLVNKNFKMARRLRDSELFMQANHAAWTTGFHYEPLKQIEGYIEDGLEIYDIKQHRLCWSRFGGHDPSVCGFGHGAWVSWLRGYPDTAAEKIARCQASAEQSGHSGSTLIALAQNCFLGYYSRNHEQVLETAEQLRIMVSELKASAHVTSIADLLAGLSAVHTGAGMQGLHRIESAIDTFTQINIRHRQSLLALIYGEALHHLGRYGQAIDTLNRGLDHAQKTGEIRWRGELDRLLTKYQLKAQAISVGQAETQLENVIAHADVYGDRMYRLRAVRDLAELLSEQQRRPEAHKLLSDELQWYTEGGQGVDLLEAKEQLLRIT